MKLSSCVHTMDSASLEICQNSNKVSGLIVSMCLYQGRFLFGFQQFFADQKSAKKHSMSVGQKLIIYLRQLYTPDLRSFVQLVVQTRSSFSPIFDLYNVQFYIALFINLFLILFIHSKQQFEILYVYPSSFCSYSKSCFR